MMAKLNFWQFFVSSRIEKSGKGEFPALYLSAQKALLQLCIIFLAEIDILSWSRYTTKDPCFIF